MITGTVALTSSDENVAVVQQLFDAVDADYDVTVTVLNSGHFVAFEASSFSLTGSAEAAGGWFVIADTSPHTIRVQNGESLYAGQGDTTGNVYVTFIGNPAAC